MDPVLIEYLRWAGKHQDAFGNHAEPAPPTQTHALVQAAFTAGWTKALEQCAKAENLHTVTGLNDMHGTPLYRGDHVRYLNKGVNTKQEYWFPIYEIVWKAPAFTLRHIGGGLDGGSHEFILRSGEGNKTLELVKRGPFSKAPADKEFTHAPHQS